MDGSKQLQLAFHKHTPIVFCVQLKLSRTYYSFHNYQGILINSFQRVKHTYSFWPKVIIRLIVFAAGKPADATMDVKFNRTGRHQNSGSEFEILTNKDRINALAYHAICLMDHFVIKWMKQSRVCVNFKVCTIGLHCTKEKVCLFNPTYLNWAIIRVVSLW